MLYIGYWMNEIDGSNVSIREGMRVEFDSRYIQLVEKYLYPCGNYGSEWWRRYDYHRYFGYHCFESFHFEIHLRRPEIRLCAVGSLLTYPFLQRNSRSSGVNRFIFARYYQMLATSYNRRDILCLPRKTQTVQNIVRLTYIYHIPSMICSLCWWCSIDSIHFSHSSAHSWFLTECTAPSDNLLQIFPISRSTLAFDCDEALVVTIISHSNNPIDSDRFVCILLVINSGESQSKAIPTDSYNTRRTEERVLDMCIRRNIPLFGVLRSSRSNTTERRKKANADRSLTTTNEMFAYWFQLQFFNWNAG